MAREEFKLPDVGEGIAEGELVNWLVEVGDTVTEDQPVAEVETDKALVDVPSPFDGTVAELRAEEGEMVPVGDVIVVFETDEPEADAESTTESDADAGTESDAAADATGDADTVTEPDATAESKPTDATDEPTGNGSVPEGRVFAPPSARRLARELGVDLTAVDGSGPGGRVTAGDVRAHAEGAGAETADDTAGETADGTASETSDDVTGPKDVDIGSGESVVSKRNGTSEVESADRDRTLAVPATRRVAREEGVDLDSVPTDRTRDGEPFVTAEQVREFAEAQRRAQAADAEAAASASAGADAATAGAASATDAGATAGPDATADAGTDEEGVAETIPYRGVRRTIGEKMAESKYTAPHVTHHDTAVVDELAATRDRLRERAAERGASLTYMPFVVKAVVAALKEFPILNSRLDEENDRIVIRDDYHIGIAVATDAGLMVPVVENADSKGLIELSEEIADLAGRARDRELSPDELRGSTFTISNFGVFGGEYATPIINYPETAIIGIGELDERAVAADGEVRAAPTMPLSTSIDHRVVDGAEAAQFTNTVMRYLESPELLLLE
ncbi:MAG: dihydrolipoamide acetyltransferase family protein [Halobaculum sp.]